MRANIPDSLRVQDIELTATDRGGGDRVLRGKVYALVDAGLLRATIRIDQPNDLNGAAYLMREIAGDGSNQLFFYLPAVGRVRRISGASVDGSLLGTDFSYSDMKELQGAFAGGHPKFERSETLDGRAVQVLTLAPAAGSTPRYSGVTAWIDQASCVALRVDFLEAGTLRKQLTAPAASLQQAGKYWYLGEVLMRDLKEGTRTRLKVLGVSGDGLLPTRLFDPNSFYLGN